MNEINEINEIKNKLNGIRNTHPNVYSMWMTYIQLKEESMKKTIREARIMLENIEQKQTLDIPIESMLCMFCLQYNDINSSLST